MKNLDYRRLVLSLNAEDLEVLCLQWVNTKKEKYHSTFRYGGSGDKGRDVAAYYSASRQEGEWDNYQCKQYSSTLGTGSGLLELGKILQYSHSRHIQPPKNYFFVAPKGINKNLQEAIDKPSELKELLISQWDKHCKTKINTSNITPLTDDLEEFIRDYDFSRVQVVNLDKIVDDEKFKSVLVEWFGGDLPSPPIGPVIVPGEIEDRERVYIDKLLEAYSENEGVEYSYVHEIEKHQDFSLDLVEQRERFFCAEVFKNFFRDITSKNVLPSFEDEIYKGISPIYRKRYDDAYERLCEVIAQAASIQPSGKLAIHAKIDVKQGYCHHFVNEGRILTWKK